MNGIDYRIKNLEDEIISLEASKASTQTYVSVNKYGDAYDDHLVIIDDSITLEIIDFIISKYKEEIKLLKKGN